MAMSSISRMLLLFVLPLLLLVTAAILANWYFRNDNLLGIAVAGSGLFAFVFFLGLERSEPRTSRTVEGSLRGAIAAGIVVQYMVLVSLVVFFMRTGNDDLAPLAQTMVSSFTTIVGVVIAFYFGASAYLQGKRPHRNSAGDNRARGRRVG